MHRDLPCISAPRAIKALAAGASLAALLKMQRFLSGGSTFGHVLSTPQGKNYLVSDGVLQSIGDIELYQWMRNKEGGQTFGNQQKIVALNREVFREHMRKGLRAEYQDYNVYRRTFPEVMASLISHDRGVTWQLFRTGTIDELRPSPRNPAWVKRVASFDSSEAIAQGETADSGALAEIAAKPSRMRG